MSHFKKIIMERIPEVYRITIGDHATLGPDGYKMAITALLGFTPSSWETDELFKHRNGLNLDELQHIVKSKLEHVYIEQYMCDMFSYFDSDFKGYITLTNVRQIWETCESSIPWSKIEECFRELTENNCLDYSTFYEIIMSFEPK